MKYFLVLYLIICKWFWLPIYGNIETRLISGIIFFFLIAFSIPNFFTQKSINKNIYIFFILLFITDFFGVFYANSEVIFDRFLNFILTFILSLIIITINEKKLDINKVIIFSTVISSLIYFIILYNCFDCTNPLTGNILYNEGFDYKNNKWAVTLSFSIAVVLGSIFHYKSKLIRLFLYLLSILLLIAVFFTYGRLGFLISLFLFIRHLNFSYKFSMFTKILLLSIFGLVIYSTFTFFIIESLKILAKSSDLSSIDANDFSAGRLSQFKYAFELLINNPFGIGWGNAPIYMQNKFGIRWEIHNMPLRVIVESGWITIVFFIYFFNQLITIYRRFHKNPQYQITLNIVIVGCLAVLLEPNYILGTFQASAMFWVSYIYLAKKI